VALWLAGALVVAFQPALLFAWQLAGAALAATLAADALAVWRLIAPPELRRTVAQSLPVGEWHKVQVRISGTRTRLRGVLQDAHPDRFESEGLPLSFRVPAGGWVELGYRVRPLARGDHTFGRADVRIDSPLLLWQRVLTCGAQTPVRVYPDFAKITQYTLFATDHRLSQIGVLLRRRRGEGLDFQQLREYRQGDSSRQIDWKASARQRKLISREYQDERDQRIVFMLDCGQRMRAFEAGEGSDALSHFDHTLNALLLLAYVALRQGDAVGVLTFAHARPRYLAPRKSVAAVSQLLNGLYDIEPSLATPDYLSASEQLLKRLNKRSLIVLLTNLRDEDDALLEPALRLLQQRHLVLLANLREVSLDRVSRAPIASFDDALTFGAAAEYVRARSRNLKRLRHRGAQVLDVYPSRLPTTLVNKYWEMKRAGQV
jgi:uncharacterized protein (DUF58 family)